MKKIVSFILILLSILFFSSCQSECEHKAVIDPAVAATCQAEGLTEGSHCSVCNEVLKKQEITPITDHSYISDYKCDCGLYLEDAKITVLSQNILCSNAGSGNDVADRAPRFDRLVKKYAPDLIGTQEVTATWNNYFRSYFGNEYEMVGCSRDGKNATTGEWGTILYRKDRFELLDNGDFWLTSTPDVVSKVRGSGCNRICTWALLKDKVTGKTLVFANTHLDHLNSAVRNQQVRYLLEGIEDFVGVYPVYLTGDFNAVPGSKAYTLVTNVFSDARTTALEGAGDTSSTFDDLGLELPGKIIDYCLYDDKSEALLYKVINESFDGRVSDHFGVLAEFIIK